MLFCIISGILKILFAPVAIVGYITAYIAVQQYKLAKQKVKLELYERRYQIYEICNDFLLSVIQMHGAGQDRTLKFNLDTKRIPFLFNEDVCNYIQQIRNHAKELNGLIVDLEMNYKNPPYNNNERVDKLHRQQAIMSWFVDELNTLEKHFQPYLNLTKL
jgi:hypothetical protein